MNGSFILQVDGDLRQKGSTGDMMFKIPFLISHISSIMTLSEGDVILTGIEEHVSLFFSEYRLFHCIFKNHYLKEPG